MPLSQILRKYTVGYKVSKSQEKINYKMYIDEIKLFAKNEREILIQTVRIYSQDTGMGFDIEKCAMLGMTSGKRHMTEGIEIKKKSERSEKRKPKNTREYGKLRQRSHRYCYMDALHGR